jgi:hypothetical protein
MFGLAHQAHPDRAWETARALGLAKADLAAMAGVDDVTVGVPQTAGT